MSRVSSLISGRVVGVLVILVIVASCGALREPDLSQLYHDPAVEEKYPLIVIPGIMGSRLIEAETGEQIWPIGIWRLLFGAVAEPLALLTDILDFRQEQPQVVPAGLLVGTVGEDFYAELLETLTEAGGYTCVPAAEVGPEADCILFDWDWRRDLVEAAARLDALIEQIRAIRGEPELKVDIVAHSAGGLVARYFVRFGDRDVLELEPSAVQPDLAGADKVRRLALIGAPNYGSIFNLQRLMRGYRVGLMEILPEWIATMPSVYQLLPHPDRTWMIDSYGNRIDRDLYEPETWRSLRESIFNPVVRQRIRDRFAAPEQADAYLQNLEDFFVRSLRRGRRFHRVLSIPVLDTPNEYILFGADCTLTPAICLLEFIDDEPKVRLHPDEVVRRIRGVDYQRLMLEPGDGRVTRSSLLARDTLDPRRPDRGFFPIDYLVFTCKEHARLAADFTIRHNLLNLLLY